MTADGKPTLTEHMPIGLPPNSGLQIDAPQAARA